MTMRKAISRSAFTLLELLLAVMIFAVISAVLLPVLNTSSEIFVTTRDVRTRSENVAAALDRLTRLIREAPIGADDSGVGVASATPTSVQFTDGTGFQLNAGAIEMLSPGAQPSPLCLDVDDLVIEYYASDGVTSTSSSPSLTHRFAITVTSGDLVLSVIVHPRVWIGQQS